MRSVVIPVKNEEDVIGDTLRAFITEPLQSTEVIIIDDSDDDSFKIEEELKRGSDDIAVYRQRSDEGKGGALRQGVERARGDVIALVDGDIETFRIDWIDRLCEPIEEDHADIVKAKYYYEGEDFVTSRIAEPLMNTLFPEVDFERPIEGEIAFSREALEDLEILPGFQAESGMVIDIVMGDFDVEEVYLGKKIHEERQGESLKRLADDVHEAILRKGLEYSRL